MGTLLGFAYLLHQKKWIGRLFAVLQWSVGLPLTLISKQTGNTLKPYCSVDLYNAKYWQNIRCITTVIHSSASLVILVLICHNYFESLRNKTGIKSVTEIRKPSDNSATNISGSIVLINSLLAFTSVIVSQNFLPSASNNFNAYVSQLSDFAVFEQVEFCLLPTATLMLICWMVGSNPCIRESFARIIGTEQQKPNPDFNIFIPAE
ncbi:unnamed protein product [Enterobius vermicularis]|uniref:Serpentine receptor class gamma n=1 Tax=Enterobius vermicularis TaxID=51028 RepID=A0A0N4VDI9_ENTVE|nr:unnamed protein product [Enterobius vermicularis]